MPAKWENYSRFGLSVASTAASVGFSAAKYGTSIGFGIARGVTSTAVSVAGYPFGVGPFLGGAVSIAFSFVEQVALAPIILGETLTSTTLVAAESSIDVLSAIFPGSDEASFSLASFVSLVRRTWNEPSYWGQFPAGRYSVTEIATALIAWGSLQGVTHEWKEKTWFSVLKEINVNDIEDDQSYSSFRERKGSRIRITSDLTRRNVGQIITAEIEDVEPSPSTKNLRPPGRQPRQDSFVYQTKLKSNLRRLSKMVLAGYGGAGLLFFGVSLDPPPPPPNPAAPNPLHDNANTPEENLLADTIDASEREASSTFHHPAPASENQHPQKYSWWNVLLGRHDKEIFEGYAFTPATVRGDLNKRARRRGKVTGKPSTAIVGIEKHMPRFWVLTDHGRKQVVLVLRGTFSLNELAVDLTCEPVPFSPARPDDPLEETPEDDVTSEEEDPSTMMPGSLPFPSVRTPKRKRERAESGSSSEWSDRETYNVHGGMLRMAQVMGAKGRPVHCAIQEALYKNIGYELILTGHSLGAGVAALLALIWANPETCLTVPSSGLPVGRRVTAYCFAPPCVVSPELSNLSRRLITSFTYSHDVVSRLSLGSVRDMNVVAAWLCEANKGGSEEGYAGVTKRALKWRAGYGRPEDPEWFLSIRKTLEANMVMADLFPPGRVLWAIRDGDLQPPHRLSGGSSGSNAQSSLGVNGMATSTQQSSPDTNGSHHQGRASHTENKVRLFDVLDVEKMFGQIIFARDILSSHLPHQYDRVLHELL